MCWIEIPTYAVAEEVRARVERDPAAAIILRPSRRSTHGWMVIAAAFVIGAAVGWCCPF
jgi:hypothetical protein